MTEVNKGNATHQRLISLLSEQGATYRVVAMKPSANVRQFLKFVVPRSAREQKPWSVRSKATALISMCWQFCPLTSRPISVC